MVLNPSQTLQNRYRIVSLLGRGGMGAVYRAWDTRLDVPVALKEMTPQPELDPHTLAQLRQQFQQEAKILARLSHPHLVRVGDFFEEGGNAYLVMDFVEGESLADRIEREGPLPEIQVLEWADQLLDALAYCHSQGVLHRDAKPQNVIIRPDGQVVLVDFGLVKLWDPRDPRTRTAMRGMGTPEYAPPEQYDIGVGHTDPRSDIYSLGATLYHALTGQSPPTATQRIASRGVFQPPRVLNQRISPTIEAAVLQAMELTVEDRFPTAQEMAAALEGGAIAPAHRAVPKRRPTRVMPGVQPIAHPRKRVQWWAWVLGGLGGLALVVGVVMGVGGIRERSAVVVEVTATPTAAVAVAEATSTLRPTSTPRPTATATATPTRQPTPIPTATPTPRPTSTPFPGIVVVPLENMAHGIPWLPLDEGAVPGTQYYGFDVNKPPFDNRLVRQAFAAAVDRQFIADLAHTLYLESAQPATTFTPPETLGRDLYEWIGLPFDPARARALLAEAGYPNSQGFPAVALVTNRGKDSVNVIIANSVVAMWRENLKVDVNVVVIDDWQAYADLLATDASAIYRLGWVADFNDPDNFLREVLHSRSEVNYGHFSDVEFDRLVEQAAALSDPATRQALYIQAERILCEDEAAVIPLWHFTASP